MQKPLAQSLCHYDNEKTYFPRTSTFETRVLNPNSIDAAIDKMDVAEKLDIGCVLLCNRGLKNFPEKVLEFENLQLLYLNANEIKEIPVGISKLKHLTHVVMDNNSLAALPKSIIGLSELKLLSLDKNQLCALPEGIGKMPKLQSLFIYGNAELADLPQDLIDAVQNKKICLRYDGTMFQLKNTLRQI